MPLQALQFRPGVSRESTSYANEGAYYACDKIRFRSGYPEKIGGWVKQGTTFDGACRHTVEWITLSNFLLLGVGTNQKYYIFSGGVYYNITPIRLSSALGTDPFLPIYSTLSATLTDSDTTISVTSGVSFTHVTPYVIRIDAEEIYVPNASGNNLYNCVRGYNGTTPAAHSSGTPVGSSWMVVSSPANGAEIGDWVTFSGATAFAIYTDAQLNNEYRIGAVDTDYIAFDLGSVSTAATAGGGSSVVAEYQIHAGAAYSILGAGWGAGPWQSLAYGTAYTTLTSTVNSSATTLNVASTTSFSASGYLMIDSELMAYTIASSTSLTVVRSATNSKGHMAGAPVHDVVYTATGRAWNTPYTSALTSAYVRLWSGDTFGQDLVYNYRGGPIYYWTASTNINSVGVVTASGVNIRALPGSDGYAPTMAYKVLVTDERYIVALGSSDIVATTTAPGALTAAISDTATTISIASTTAFGAVSDTGYLLVGTELMPYTIASATDFTVERDTEVATSHAIGAVVQQVNYTEQDPLLVSWCSQESPIIWNASDVTNTAGNQRLTYGSKIITSEKTRQETLIWTDSALYSMRYLGPPYVFGFNVMSNATTIASMNASATANGVTYWMGYDKFYVYSGQVDTLPCALRQYVFDDINNNQLDQVYAGTNERYNEVWWCYPSTDAVNNDRYVVYNYLEKLWYYGTLDRTSWYDSHIRTYPVTTTYSITSEKGQLYYQEYGADDGSTNPASAMYAYIESADFDLGEGGNQFSFVKRIIPDVDFIGSTNTTPSVTMTLQARNFPGVGTITNPMQTTDATIAGTKVSTQVYNYTNQSWIRLRGRQIIFRIESDQLGVQWQLGTPRLEIQPDGKRG